MRITSNTFPDSLIGQLSHLSVRQNRLQSQAATGQRVQNPSDDPAAFTRVLSLQAESRQTAQYVENVERLLETSRVTYDTMRGLKTVSDRATELGVLADGTKSKEELEIYAQQVTSLIEQAVTTANTQFGDRYLLAGTLTDKPPFEMTKDADGHVTAVTYVGNTNVAEAEIGEGVTLASQTLGANTSGAGPRGLVADGRFGADLFNHLISLQNNLLAGDVDAISSTDVPALLTDEDNLLVNIGMNGAMQARLESAKARGQRSNESREILVSKEVDADIAETIVRLNQTQLAYQAALQTGGQLLNNTLLDYLR